MKPCASFIPTKVQVRHNRGWEVEVEGRGERGREGERERKTWEGRRQVASRDQHNAAEVEGDERVAARGTIGHGPDNRSSRRKHEQEKRRKETEDRYGTNDRRLGFRRERHERGEGRLKSRKTSRTNAGSKLNKMLYFGAFTTLGSGAICTFVSFDFGETAFCSIVCNR
jgi:hypothetical protein